MSSLQRLNGLSSGEARAELLRCCGSTRWAERMAAARPFGGEAALLLAADAIWGALEVSDWFEAFAAHPRIGSKKDVAHAPAGTGAWAEGEQRGTEGAAASTLAGLAEANRAYEARFGFIYLVCATGKSADELLALCRERLHHDRDVEVAVAAEEQRKITRLRLEKMLRGG